MEALVSNSDLGLIRNWLGTGSINVFGRPFSGKDTQCKRMAQFLDASIIGGGDIVRASNTHKIKQIIDTGSLAPQEEYLAMVLPYLSLPEFEDRPLILNSLGRWSGEEDPITHAADAAHHPLKAVIALSIPEEVVYERWEMAKAIGDRGDRNDDNAQSITTRLAEYRNKTKSVLDYYRSKHILFEVDGTQSLDTVTKEILEKLLGSAKD